MFIPQLGDLLNNFLIANKNVINIKILKALGENIFLIDTSQNILKAKILGDVQIGDAIRAKLLSKTEIPIFQKVSQINDENRTDKKLMKQLDNFNYRDFEVKVLSSIEKNNIKEMINEEKIKLLDLLSKLQNRGEKIDINNINNFDSIKSNSKDVLNLLFNRSIVVYFRSPEYDIKDGILHVKKSKKQGIRCKLFIFFSNIGRVFIFISGLKEKYNVVVRSEMDISDFIKNISINNTIIKWKKIDEKKDENDNFFHSNYLCIKI
jgi:hypothetical protein